MNLQGPRTDSGQGRDELTDTGNDCVREGRGRRASDGEVN